jgi:hypothetical protein
MVEVKRALHPPSLQQHGQLKKTTTASQCGMICAKWRGENPAGKKFCGVTGAIRPPIYPHFVLRIFPALPVVLG